MGDYCIMHAPGPENFKANLAMLYRVYEYVRTAVEIITAIGVIVGLPRIFNLVHKGETRTLKLADVKDSAEQLMGILDLLAEMDDPREEIESIGEAIIILHEDVLSIVQQLATSALQVEALTQVKREAEQR